MNREKILELFKNFLEKEGISPQYFFSIAYYNAEEIVKHLYEVDLIEEVINYSLFWENTPEGWCYWDEIDEKWREFISLHLGE